MRECVYGVSHLPIFSILRSSRTTTTKDESSTHKPLAYLLDIYYTRKAIFSQANSRQNPRDWSDERRNPLLSHGPAAVGGDCLVNFLFYALQQWRFRRPSGRKGRKPSGQSAFLVF